MQHKTRYTSPGAWFDDENWPCEQVERNKDAVIRTHMHYTDPQANQEITVFGEAKPGLFYNYSDRLSQWLSDWGAGLELAKRSATVGTARYFEIALKHFHHSDSIDIQHIILGVNRSNGFDYLVFGYTYAGMQ